MLPYVQVRHPHIPKYNTGVVPTAEHNCISNVQREGVVVRVGSTSLIDPTAMARGKQLDTTCYCISSRDTVWQNTLAESLIVICLMSYEKYWNIDLVYQVVNPNETNINSKINLVL